MPSTVDKNFCVRYTANGDTLIFPFDFTVPDDSWVSVQQLRPTDTSSQLVPADDYKVNLHLMGGSVVFYNPPSAGTIIIIFPSSPSVPSSNTVVPAPAIYQFDLIDKFTQEGNKIRQDLSALVEQCNQAKDQGLAEVNKVISAFISTLSEKEEGITNLIKTEILKYTTTVTRANEDLESKVKEYFQDIQNSSEALDTLQAGGLNTLQDKATEALTGIKDFGQKFIDSFIDEADIKLKELISIYEDKYKELQDYKAELQVLPADIQTEAINKTNVTYKEFIEKVKNVEQSISESISVATADITAVSKDTQDGLEKWAERAATDLNQATAEAIKEITDHGEQVCAELDKLISDFNIKVAAQLTDFGTQVEQCVSKACAFAQAAVEAQCEAEKAKDLAYSAAGNKGWIAYRVRMPETTTDIEALHKILNDGGIIVAGGSDPEDGGGNPTGGTDTEDFWHMVSTVESYQKVVEQLLSNLTPDDIANLKSYFEILTKVLNSLQDMQAQLNNFHITDASLSERITRNSHAIAILYSIVNAQKEQIELLANGISDLASLTDDKINQTGRDSAQRYNELREEHNRMGFLIAQLEKRVTSLENKRGRHA